MALVRLLSWHADIGPKTELLESKGIQVDSTPLVRTSAVVGELARQNPAALVLDLDRLPSNVREIALMLRASKSARHIPILLAGNEPAQNGLPEKYSRLKSELPDIPYAAWPDARQEMRKLLEQPGSATFLVPLERVYTASLAQKLGIIPATSKYGPSGPSAGPSALTDRRIALIGAPDNFVELLGDLPDGLRFTSGMTAKTHLALCFIRSSGDLGAAFAMMELRLPPAASAWIIYPKRTSEKHRDFNENDVREGGLAVGLVDYKICSVDAEWSGMKFARRKRKSS